MSGRRPKQHHCARCRKRGARGLVRIARRTGGFSEYCQPCLDSIVGKGARVVVVGRSP